MKYYVSRPMLEGVGQVREAWFSEDMKFRYKLQIKWARTWEAHFMNFVMLNPSKADHEKDDPTVRKCCKLANRLGFGGIIVTNIFAYRATDPKKMRAADSPVGGTDNNKAIIEAADASGMILCAWGDHGRFQYRGWRVMDMLKPRALWSLAVTKKGMPQHPLYIKDSINPTPYDAKPSDFETRQGKCPACEKYTNLLNGICWVCRSTAEDAA